MKSQKLPWGIIALAVLVTLSITFAPTISQSQLNASKDQGNKKSTDLTKYPVVDYDAAEPLNATEREERKRKGMRYDRKAFVIPNPRPDFIMSTIFDAEPIPDALPYKESKLVVIGEILAAKAAMSNEKSAVYSEFTVQITEFLKQPSGCKLQVGQQIYIDRAGGRVHYPNGATILYLNDWQDLPESIGKYLFFLDAEDDKAPNFRIITAYRLEAGQVTALDHSPSFREFNGRATGEFVNIVKGKRSEKK